MNQPIDLPLASAVLVIIVSSCLPAITGLLIQLYNNAPRNYFYEDADGCGTPESVALFSNRSCKNIILFFSAAGFGISVALVILECSGTANHGTKLEAGIFTSAWVSLNNF